jgi:NTE family protein
MSLISFAAIHHPGQWDSIIITTTGSVSESTMQKFRIAAAIFLLLSFPESSVFAEQDGDRPKIGLALSGGGARGGAHVGVLRALEELNVPVDYIAGTSMGAIIGGLYASGYSADEVEQILIDTDWDKGLTDRPARKDRTMRKKELEAQFLIPYRVGFNNGKFQMPLGAIEGQHLDQIFHKLLLPVVGIDNFDQLSIPFRAVATDLVTGDAVILAGGSLPNALRASMSVPGIFAPVRIDDRLLVDGGMSNNLPISVVRQMGADIVIAVDISTPLLKEEQLTSILSVTEQLTSFLTRRTTELQIALLGPRDVLIVPELGDFSSGDFEGAENIMPLGYDAVMQAQDSFVGLVSNPTPRPVQPLSQSASDYIVHFVDIDNGSVLNDELIRSRLPVELGQPIDLPALDESLDKIYSLDVFKSVTYDLILNDEDQTGIVVHASPRDWGPNYFQFGLELSSDFSEFSTFKLGAAYTRNALNSLGGELRVVGSIGREDEISFDFYQPIDLKANWFVEPQVYWKRQNYNWWEEDVNIAELQIKSAGLVFGFGRNLSTTDRLRLDYEFARGEAKVITGDLGFPIDDRLKVGELKLEYLHDSLDSLWFPTSGMLHQLSYLYASDNLGASGNYQQATVNGTFTYSRGENRILFNYGGGYSFDDQAPIERWFRLGGLGRLSGLAPEQLSGRQLAMGTLAYYRRLSSSKLISTYTGFSLEAGNVWEFSDEMAFDDLRYSASIFVGADTPIGPVYFAAGHSDNGDNAVYFYVGNPFRVGRFD